MTTEEVLYEVYVRQSDYIMKRIVALDAEFHEHSGNCEIRCPKQAERNTLFDVLGNLGKVHEPYFRGGQ